MGKIQILTKEQQIILAEVGRNSFFKQFYFTGGTALSAYYLYHRYSEDLDFFVEKIFDDRALLTIVEIWSKKYNFTFTSEFREVVYIFMLKFANNKILKVDFSYYPYKRIKESVLQDGIKIDSFTDIAVNKLLTVTQRTTIKDFVDLYFLLQKISLWDIIEGVRIKFKMELEPFVLASDFLKIEDFDYLPRMIKKVDLKTLKEFYRENAKNLGRRSIS